MCLTAKPTVECSVSTAQVEPVGIEAVGAMAVMFECLLEIKWTVVRFVAGTVAHETDCGPVIVLITLSDLPLFNAEPPERADAARNRRLVLDAARKLFADNPRCVTMEAVAAEAGVGKGTVFRRFGDRATLARAVISEIEIELQEGMIRGAPPLGPGAPARERLLAFGARTWSSSSANAELMLAAEGPTHLARQRRLRALPHPRRAAARAGRLRRERRLPGRRVMAPLAAPTFVYHRRVRSLSLQEQVEAYRGPGYSTHRLGDDRPWVRRRRLRRPASRRLPAG